MSDPNVSIQRVPANRAEDAPDECTAEVFRRARQAATALAEFPGPVPSGLSAAYAIQDIAIARWPDRVAGWKVGMILGDNARRFGSNRLAGPIFAGTVQRWKPGEVAEFAIIEGGFAAVEAELVFVTSQDAPPDKKSWSLDEAAGMIGAVRAGIEIAGSPLPTINDLGPPVIIADFGNNTGLILGPELDGWQEFLTGDHRVETRVGDVVVGSGRPRDLNGGALESLRFMLENAAARGYPLKRGTLVSSGAITGVHDIRPGQESSIRFSADLVLDCRAVRAGR